MDRLALDIRLSLPDLTLDLADEIELVGITALFGPSGAGKSTLLRVIAGHERRAKGTLRFAGETWQDAQAFCPAHRRGVGYLFQDLRLFPHLSVHGNLRYAARRAPHATGSPGLAEVVEALDLGSLLARRIHALSGGERQRVALARTLLGQPRLLLMDEPLAALDYRRKAEIMPYLAALPDRFGMPVIYVTHALDEVVRLAARMVVMAGGRIKAIGATPDILARLDLQEATGHFEAGAALDGQILSHDPRFRLTRVGVEGQHVDMPQIDLPVGTRVRLRLRARDVALAIARPAGLSVRNLLEGRIAEIVEEPETAFAETLIAVGAQRLRARITRAAVAELGLEAGMPVYALVKSIAFDRRIL